MSVSDTIREPPILFRWIWNKFRIISWILELSGFKTILRQSMAIILYIEKLGVFSLQSSISSYKRFINSLSTLKFSSTFWIAAANASHYINFTLQQYSLRNVVDSLIPDRKVAVALQWIFIAVCKNFISLNSICSEQILCIQPFSFIFFVLPTHLKLIRNWIASGHFNSSLIMSKQENKFSNIFEPKGTENWGGWG